MEIFKNPIVIIIFVVFIVLMVAFGNNPVDEMRARIKAERGGRDALTYAIDQFQKKSPHGNSFGGGLNNIGGGGGGGYGEGGYRGGLGNGNNNMGGNMGGGIYGERLNQRMQNNQNQQDYYPPAPAGAQPQSYDILPNAPAFPTSSGQRVRFAGIKVYTVNAQGITVPMPDGRYIMNGITMVIRNGKKIMTAD